MERMDTTRLEQALAKSLTAQMMSANLSDAMMTAIVTGIARAYSLGVQDGGYHVLGHEKAERSHRSLIHYGIRPVLQTKQLFRFCVQLGEAVNGAGLSGESTTSVGNIAQRMQRAAWPCCGRHRCVQIRLNAKN